MILISDVLYIHFNHVSMKGGVKVQNRNIQITEVQVITILYDGGKLNEKV